MDTQVHLLALPEMHPRLLWDEIIAAAFIVLHGPGRTPPFRLELEVKNVPGAADQTLRLAIDPAGIDVEAAERIRRTYDPARLVELAAIAIAGLGLYHAGGHEIRDVALRETGADYLVDDAGWLAELAGRSRGSDLDGAWKQRWDRLSERDHGFFVCVVEFETPAGRLAFQHQG
jgi:hypothetical protein